MESREPGAKIFVEAVGRAGELLDKDGQEISRITDDQDVQSRLMQKLRGVLQEQFPETTDIAVYSEGNDSYRLFRGKSWLVVRIKQTKISREAVLSIPRDEYLIDLDIRRKSDLLDLCKVVAYLLIGVGVVIYFSCEPSDDGCKLLLFLSGALVLLVLGGIASLVNRRSHKDFPAEVIERLSKTMRELVESELKQAAGGQHASEPGSGQQG